jgi:catechol 2,3-dioxygenase-like lactoylglutathione lyase family enzyme
MNVTGLHHFNITATAELIQQVLDFYVQVLGLEVGERPAFRRQGFWLYAGAEPVVHLTICDAGDIRARGAQGFFDHLAFSCKGLPEIVARLKDLRIPYEVIELPALSQTQIFVRDPAGIGIELNFVDESLA